MKKLLLLDKDGTIVTSTHESGFIEEPWHQKPIHPCPEILRQAKKAGWEIKVCSNQGGVAAGHKSLEKVFQEMRFCLELFPEIEEAWFCPDYQGEIAWYCWDDCSQEHQIERKRSLASAWYESGAFASGPIPFPSFRKPGSGMLLAASDLVCDRILYIGDRPEDEAAAKSAGFSFLWAEDWRNDRSWMN